MVRFIITLPEARKLLEDKGYNGKDLIGIRQKISKVLRHIVLIQQQQLSSCCIKLLSCRNNAFPAFDANSYLKWMRDYNPAETVELAFDLNKSFFDKETEVIR